MKSALTAVAAASRPLPAPGPLLLDMLGRRIVEGTLSVELPDGREVRYGGGSGPRAHWRLASFRPLYRLLTRGATGLAESWMAGEWETPSLQDFMLLAALNEQRLGSPASGLSLARISDRLLHLVRRNSRSRARANIAYHYDLGNAFYRAWLDDTMTYSSAVFEHEDEPLEDAQTRKNARLAGLLELSGDHSVLEIGCGWGGFMEHAARRHGAHVTGVSISREQVAYARERLAGAGLDGLADVQFRDYRDLDGSFDRIVSVEMFEAVGEAWWDTYAATLKRLLKPGGSAALQVITIDEARFATYRRSADFIQRYVFPGGMLPTKQTLEETLGRAGLVVTERLDFGLDYARTLAHWRERFDRAWPAIERLTGGRRFDERFRRLWQFYLAYCEAGFRSGSIDVVQVRAEHA